MMTAFLYDYVFHIFNRGWQVTYKQNDANIQASGWLLRMSFDWLITKFASVMKIQKRPARNCEVLLKRFREHAGVSFNNPFLMAINVDSSHAS